MVDQIRNVVSIEFTQAEYELLKECAQYRGFDDPAEYMRALFREDETYINDEDTDEEILEGFRQGWRDAMSGNTISWEEFVKEMQEDQEPDEG